MQKYYAKLLCKIEFKVLLVSQCLNKKGISLSRHTSCSFRDAVYLYYLTAFY